MKIGYLGPRGTFTEQAARRFFNESRINPSTRDLKPYRSIPELLRDVENETLDAGVAPIENSMEGSVSITLDCLVHEVNLHITGEVVLPVVHHLMARQGVPIDAIEGVISHPQALAQCRKNLDKLLPNAAQFAATSTAEAVQQAAAQEHLAALGTALAAELYGLEIIKSNMQDSQENATRFVVVTKDRAPKTGFDKTSVAFAFQKDRPGNLYRALGSFAQREINLTKLESRPAKQSLGEYLFLADMEGHIDDPPIADALEEVKKVCDFFKVLGAFPRVDYRFSHNGKDDRGGVSG